MDNKEVHNGQYSRNPTKVIKKHIIDFKNV